MTTDSTNGQAPEETQEYLQGLELEGAPEPENFTVGFHTEATGVFVLNIPINDMYKAVELLNKFLNEAGVNSFITKENEEGV